MADTMVSALFGSVLRAKAVGYLFGHPDEEFYVTQIANAVGEPVSNLSLELRKDQTGCSNLSVSSTGDYRPTYGQATIEPIGGNLALSGAAADALSLPAGGG